MVVVVVVVVVVVIVVVVVVVVIFKHSYVDFNTSVPANDLSVFLTSKIPLFCAAVQLQLREDLRGVLFTPVLMSILKEPSALGENVSAVR